MSVSTETTTYVPVVGDVFVASWGYDQTNVDFYRVVGTTPSGKSVKIQQVQTLVLSEESGCARVVATDEPAQVRIWNADRTNMISTDAPVETKRVNTRYSGGPRLALTSYSSAWLWDGRSMHATASGWGH